MVCTPIYYFSAPKGKSLEPATSSHPIEVEGYEIHRDFISLVRKLNFLEPNPQDFEEVDVLDFFKIE
jgi:nitroimidazol reductase NimA-like FMN-containing flavoprotein (pyridoxamine 5'-phosphate oxidase superfamily)